MTSFMLDRVQSGMVVYDVGAHYGYFTLLASRLAPNGHVHSFEPTPRTFRLLHRNAGQRGNVTLNQAAVWHEAAQLDMKDFGATLSMYNSLFDPRLPDDANPTVTEHRVTAVALDDYAASHQPPGFVKIDAESAELHVIDGMAGLIDRHRPIITLEVGDFDVPDAPPSRALLERVIDYGYRPFEFSQGQIRPHELCDRYGYDNILLVST